MKRFESDKLKLTDEELEGVTGGTGLFELVGTIVVFVDTVRPGAFTRAVEAAGGLPKQDKK